MAFADANRAQIRYLEEATFGTTPASGSSREVRLTSSSLSANKETVVSDELRADRMVSDIVEVSASSGGDINFEWSSGPQDEFLAAFLLGAWARPMTMDFWEGIIVSVTGVDEVTVSGRDISTVSGYLVSGRRIKLDGFINSENNGYFQISTAVLSGSDTVITLTTSTCVVETGTVNSRIYDANDVIILNSTAIASAVAGLDGGATDPFAAAVAAGQLVVGQKIFVENADAYESGTVVITAAQVITNLTLTVDDGVNSYPLVAGVDFAVGVDTDTDGQSLSDAINALRFRTTPILVKSVYNTGTDTLTVTNLRVTGGALTETVDDTNVTVTNFSGGVAGVVGIFSITSVTDDDIGLSPAPAVLAAGGNVTIKGSHLRNPGDITAIQQRYFSIETAYQDIGQFQEQDGMVAGTFALEIATGAIVTGTIGFEGRATSLVQATVLGTAPYLVLDAQPGDVVNATTDVGDLTKDGAALLACIQSISLSGEAGLRMQNCVGEKFPRGIGTGRFNLTGSMTVYFEDEVLFTDFIDHDTISLEFSITDSEGMAYYFNIPSLKISQDEIAPGGIDQDVFENIEFTAFRDATTNTMIMIDRFSPNSPV